MRRPVHEGRLKEGTLSLLKEDPEGIKWKHPEDEGFVLESGFY